MTTGQDLLTPAA